MVTSYFRDTYQRECEKYERVSKFLIPSYKIKLFIIYSFKINYMTNKFNIFILY